jgi:Flp pilus assembly protein TadD
VALATSVLGLVVLGAGGWTYLAQQRQEWMARLNRALGEADGLYAEAKRAGDDLTRWLTARDAAHALKVLLADAPDEPTRRHVTVLVRDVTHAAEAAQSDQELLAKLVDIRSAKYDDPDGTVTDAAYAGAFREAGIDVAALTSAEVGAKVQTRPSAVRVVLAAAFDDWAALRWGRRKDRAGARQLTEVARVADPDPWRNQLRELLQASSNQERLTPLKVLARSARFDELPAVSLDLLGEMLLDSGDPAGAEVVLREGQLRYPGDIWLNHTLARCLERLVRREEAIRYYMAARSLRPETAHELAHALEQNGETDRAIAIFQGLARVRPKEGRNLACLAKTLQDRGRTAEAEANFNASIASSRAAIQLGYNNIFHPLQPRLRALPPGKAGRGDHRDP